MKELILKIVTKKMIDLSLSRDQMVKFPTHYCRQIIYDEKMLTIEYKPAKGFDEEGFKALILKKYKGTLNAHSFEFVEREQVKSVG